MIALVELAFALLGFIQICNRKKMAVSITSNATSLEGQIWELAVHAQIAELAIDAATRPNNIQTNIDTENQLVSVTFSVPATFSLSSEGALVASPTPYLP